MARYFLEKYCRADALVLDPFCGKGTVLLEAVASGRRAIGFDVAPDAVIVANAKVDPPSRTALTQMLKSMANQRSLKNPVPWQVRVFFSEGTLRRLTAVRDYLLKAGSNGDQRRRKAANFLLGTLLGSLHGHAKHSLSLPCSHSFAMAPNYVKRYAREEGLRRPAKDVLKCLETRAVQLLKDGLPKSRGRAYAVSAAEAHPLRRFKRGPFADLILTSPPYLNVQTYAKDSWLRLWLLNHDYRRLKPRFIETGSPKLYLEKMRPCLVAMLKALKPSGYAVIVAGDAPYTRKKRKRYFRTATQLGALASGLRDGNYKFKVLESIRDSIPSHTRYYAAVHKDGKKSNNHADRKGVRVERILVLRKIEAATRGQPRS